MEKEVTKDSFDLKEMAKELGISTKTLLNRMSARKAHPPFIRIAHGVYQFPKSSYQKWLASKVVQQVAS